MRFRNTLILAVVVVVVAAFFYIFVVRPASRIPMGKERMDEERKLVHFEPDSATSINLVRKGEKIVLEKTEEEKWRITSPVDRRADSSAISSLLSDVEYLKKEGTIKEKDFPEDGLAAYGLDAPRYALKVGLDSRELAIQFGSLDAKAEKVYVKLLEEPTVYLVDDGILSKLKKSVRDLCDRKLLDVSRYDVTGVVVKSARQTIELAKKQGHWRISQPLSVRASQNTVDELLGKLIDLEAESFVADKPEELSSYGLDNPVVTATLKLGEKKVALLFGGVVAGDRRCIYAKSDAEPLVVSVKTGVLDDLGISPQSLRDREVSHLLASEVKTIEIRLPGQDLMKLEKEGDEWESKKFEELEFDKDAVDDFLKSIADAEVKKFVADKIDDPTEYGLKEPRATIALSSSGGAELIRLGARKTEIAYLQLDDEDEVLGVEPDFAKQAVKGLLAFRSKKLTEIAKSDVKELSIQRQDGLFVAEKVVDEWKLSQPVRAQADSSAIDDVLNGFAPFKAESLLSDQEQGLKFFGLDRPLVKVTVKSVKEDGTSQKKALLVGVKQEQGYAAKFEDAPLIFTISESMWKHLQAELRDRSIFSFDKDKVVGLGLQIAGKTQEAEKEKDAWQLVLPAAGKLLEDNLTDILDLLDDLKTERFTQYDAKDLKPFGLDAPVVTVTVRLPLREETLLVGGARDKNSYYAAVQNSSAVFLLKKSDVKKLEKGLVKVPEKQTEAGKQPSSGSRPDLPEGSPE